MTALRRAALLALLAAPLLARAEERILVVRTMEDPRFPYRADVCAAAPFQSNVFLGASAWTIRTRARDGALVNDDVRFLGPVTGCGRLTTVSPLVNQPFLIHFDLHEGSYTAVGACSITSNGVPAAGLLLLSCGLNIVAGPPGTIGGSATSASVFNPLGIPGFDTGSIWTLRIHHDGR